MSTNNFVHTIKRFFSPIKVRWGIFIVIGWVCITSFFHIFEVTVARYIVASLEQWTTEFLRWIWLGIAIAIVIWLLWFWRRPKTEEVIYQTILQTYEFAMPWFFHLDQQSIAKMGTWKIQEIIIKGITTRWRIIYGTIYEGVGVIIKISASLILIFMQSIEIGLLWLGVIVLVIWRMLYRNTAEKSKRHAAKNEHITLSQWLIRQVMNTFEIIQSQKEWFEIRKIAKITQDIIQKEKTLEKHKYLTYQSMKYIFLILWFCVSALIGRQVFGGNTTIADYIFITWLFATITWSVRSISERLRNLTRELVHIEKLRELFDKTPSRSWQDTWEEFIVSQWDIQIKNISFSYDDEPVFNKFSLHIAGWKRTAFVGESWSGKTTLIKLLAAYMRPDQWDIIIDGQKLSDIKLGTYYRHIGYLTQDPSIFDGTIYENLCYALDKKPDAKTVEKVLRLAKCEFVFELKRWLQTQIGERWVLLSWWQKQRLAIAKIMLKNPSIILLDEPTSALDSFNEEQISIALHNLFQWKTVIVIAHRLQTVKQADRILLFENGKVIEDGTHSELVKKNGKYKKMLDLQSGF
jgi:ABC-type multidrug transport system fused ATPase/permease subunit